MSGIDMRDAFFDEVYILASRDRSVIFITADMGAFSITKFKKGLPGQYINAGIAEQNMVSIAAGLALGGKKVFIYSIIPFVTLRCFEQIKIDLCCMNLPVTIVGVGPGFTYGSDGPTHHATQDIAVMRTLPEITILNPSDSVMARACAELAYRNSGPVYVRIDKGAPPPIYTEKDSFLDGLSALSKGRDLTVISTGNMVRQALDVAQELARHAVSAGVIDLYRIKPLNQKKLLKIIKGSNRIVTLEENTIVGGIGSAISEFLIDNEIDIPLKRFAVPDEHCFKPASRESLHEFYALDCGRIVKNILKWVSK